MIAHISQQKRFELATLMLAQTKLVRPDLTRDEEVDLAKEYIVLLSNSSAAVVQAEQELKKEHLNAQ